MLYNEKKFLDSVEEYRKEIGDVKGKSFLIVFDIDNENAFYSIAPLSRAIHESGADVNAVGIDKKSEALDALKEVYGTYKIHKEGNENEKTKALIDFIKEVDRKMKGEFEKLFEMPDFIVGAKAYDFEGSFTLPFKAEWFVENRKEELFETCKILWRDVYNLQKGEKVNIGFLLLPIDNMLGHPLWHYLDSYAISRSMMLACKDGRKINMSAYSVRDSMLANS